MRSFGMLCAAAMLVAALARPALADTPYLKYTFQRDDAGRVAFGFYARASGDSPFRIDTRALRARYRRVDVPGAPVLLTPVGPSIARADHVEMTMQNDTSLTIAYRPIDLAPGLYRFDLDFAGLTDRPGHPIHVDGSPTGYLFLPAESAKRRAADLAVLKQRFASNAAVVTKPLYLVGCGGYESEPIPAGTTVRFSRIVGEAAGEAPYAPEAQVRTAEDPPGGPGTNLQWLDGFLVELEPSAACNDGGALEFKTAFGLQEYLKPAPAGSPSPAP